MNFKKLFKKAEFYEKNYHVYYSHKKATYFSYNNDEIKELLSIEFPNDYYYKMVVYSGYYPQTPINGIKIPAKGYIGGSGEDEDSIIHMEKFFSPVFGEENLITVNAGHANVPQAALNLDENKDNKSDLIEWMLS